MQSENSDLKMKFCSECEKTLPFSEFYSRHGGRLLFKRCKQCELTAQKNNQLNLKYGISYKVYEQLLKNQNYSCAICGKEHADVPEKKWGRARLAVDHSHNTGDIRGLLCFECNTGLGHLRDSIEVLEKAIEYLKKSPYPFKVPKDNLYVSEMIRST